uniref:Sushi domain-containing protein n=1 Tax=Timema monikensis TaxID=170555 RepID=A0A7R9EH64_9NEOP|nr:unnamed protein product [Timema monikensis]
MKRTKPTQGLVSTVSRQVAMEVWWPWKFGGYRSLVAMEVWWPWKFVGHGSLVAIEVWWPWKFGGYRSLVAMEVWWPWKRRNPEKPNNRYLVAVYRCEEGHELRDPGVDRVYCSKDHWVGETPVCVTTGESRDYYHSTVHYQQVSHETITIAQSTTNRGPESPSSDSQHAWRAAGWNKREERDNLCEGEITCVRGR